MGSLLQHAPSTPIRDQWSRNAKVCTIQQGCQKGGHSNSFRENKKPILCLHCGYMGHHACNCSSTQSNHPECPISCDWKLDKLLSKSNKLICIMYNICGTCSDPAPNHG